MNDQLSHELATLMMEVFLKHSTTVVDMNDS
jgi:hypothetical protein